jgi:hypothetical protein
MKEKLLLTVSSLLVASFAQLNAQELTGTPKENKTETVTPLGTEPVPVNQIDRQIAAIDAKFAYYSKNQAEYDKAKADGTMDALETKRQQLVLEKNKSTNTTIKPIELKAASSGTVSTGNTAPAETVEHLDYVIKAIDNKVAHVKSDQGENQQALETGWYDMMAKQRASLVEKRTTLLKSQEENK